MAITRIEDREGNEMDINPDGSFNARITQGVVIDSWEGATTEIFTFPEEANYIAVVNDGVPDLIFTIGSISVKVREREVFKESFAPFTKLEINASGPYRAIVKG